MATENYTASSPATEDELFSEVNPPKNETAVDETDSEIEGEGDESKSELASNPGLLPKSFFEGKDLEPGTVCRVKIEKVYDDQVSVKYLPHEAESDREDMMPEGDKDLEEMMG